MKIVNGLMTEIGFGNAEGDLMKTLLMLLIGLSLLIVYPAHAQVITVNINTATMTWAWTLAPGSDPADGFRMHCGNATNTYTISTDIPDPAARTISVKQVVRGTGTYFCVITAYNKVGESPLSNEINFFAGAAPSGSLLLNPPK